MLGIKEFTATHVSPVWVLTLHGLVSMGSTREPSLVLNFHFLLPTNLHSWGYSGLPQFLVGFRMFQKGISSCSAVQGCHSVYLGQSKQGQFLAGLLCSQSTASFRQRP